MEFGDGRRVWIAGNAYESIRDSYGSEAWMCVDGTVSVDSPNGRRSWIHEDGQISLDRWDSPIESLDDRLYESSLEEW